MRTRNFRAWNEGSGERNSNQESKKGEKPAWRGKWENAISGKQLDSLRRKTHVVSVMIEHLETDAVRGKNDNRPLLHQKRRHRLTERFPQKVHAAEEKVLLDQEVRFRAEISLQESSRMRNLSHPPVCLNYKSESGCTCGDKCRFRNVEADGQPSKKSKKSV